MIRFISGFSRRAIGSKFSLTPHLSLRFQSSHSTETLTESLNLLRRITDPILNKNQHREDINDKSGVVNTEEILASFKTLQDQIDNSGSSEDQTRLNEETSKLFRDYLLSLPSSQFNNQTVRNFFLTKPSFRLTSTFIKSYYLSASKNVIPIETAMIPLRELVYQLKLQDAIKLVDLTAGSKRYISYKTDLWHWMWYRFIAGVGSLLGSIDIMIRLFFPEILEYGVTGIYVMICAYFVNVAYFLSISLVNNSEMPIRFAKGTLQGYWYKHDDELRMFSMIMTADADVNGKEGFATREVVSEIEKRNFEINEPETEILLRQYWISNGNGFTWVEPDLDPAEIQWSNYLKQSGIKSIDATGERLLPESMHLT